MKVAIIALSALLAGPVFAEQVFGVHLGTYHSPNIECDNGNNPGLYYRAESGIVLGTYHNSCERQSYYMGYRTPEWMGFGVMFAGVTGYVEQVTPLAFPTYSFHMYDGYRARISGASWDEMTVVHFSVEKRF